MKRIIDYYLLEWKQDRLRQPLLLRGARQIGKTYAVRQLGKTYENFVEINLEFEEEAHIAFQGTLDPKEILMKLILAIKKNIIPGKTLLFLDEIQVLPRAITALRYFYELMPELHVIAAGSLLDFTIAEIGLPVGRVQIMYMQPASFVEYLACKHPMALQYMLEHQPDTKIEEPLHSICLKLLGEYIAIGGMPKSIQEWVDYQKPLHIQKLHARILEVYRQDFSKYARDYQIKYVEKIFEQVPKQLGQKFKYSLVEGDYRKRELAPSLDLLVTAGVVQKVYYSSAQGLPLGSQSDDLDYKVIFLDIALALTDMDCPVAPWFLHPQEELINKGQIVEALIGQELMAYADPNFKNRLHYWHKEGKAEIDYLIAAYRKIVPIEVKSGKGNTLRSLYYFLDSHLDSPYGIKFSTQDYSITEQQSSMHPDKIHTVYCYPLYAVAKVMSDYNPETKAAILSLLD